MKDILGWLCAMFLNFIFANVNIGFRFSSSVWRPLFLFEKYWISKKKIYLFCDISILLNIPYFPPWIFHPGILSYWKYWCLFGEFWFFDNRLFGVIINMSVVIFLGALFFRRGKCITVVMFDGEEIDGVKNLFSKQSVGDHYSHE